MAGLSHCTTLEVHIHFVYLFQGLQFTYITIRFESSPLELCNLAALVMSHNYRNIIKINFSLTWPRVVVWWHFTFIANDLECRIQEQAHWVCKLYELHECISLLQLWIFLCPRILSCFRAWEAVEHTSWPSSNGCFLNIDASLSVLISKAF